MSELTNNGDRKKPVLKTSFGLPKFREKVLESLSDAYVKQQLETEDYEKRVQVAYDAKSIQDLEMAVHDFPNRAEILGQEQQVSSGSTKMVVPTQVSSDVSFTIIGDKKLYADNFGQAPAQAVSLIGDLVIDLRDITENQVFEVSNISVIGDTKILVPEGVRVEQQIFTVIGDFKKRKKREVGKAIKKMFGAKQEEPPKEKPLNHSVVKLKGFKLIGDIRVIYY